MAHALLIHKWLRDPKFAPGPEIFEDEVGETPCFLPVEIVARSVAEESGTARVANAASDHSAIEIDIAGWP